MTNVLTGAVPPSEDDVMHAVTCLNRPANLWLNRTSHDVHMILNVSVCCSVDTWQNI